MTEIDRIAGLYVIPLAALFISLSSIILVIICFIYLKTNQKLLITINASLDLVKEAQKNFERDQGKRYRSVENNLQEINHEHALFERFLKECKKALETIEKNTSDIKEKQANYLNKNSNEANGNKVKIMNGEKKAPDTYNAELVHQLFSQIVNRLQDHPQDITQPPPPRNPLSRNKK